jgi:hypothetical protein
MFAHVYSWLLTEVKKDFGGIVGNVGVDVFKTGV